MRPLIIGALVAIIGLSNLAGTQLFGQIKYSPNDDLIRGMTKQAVDWMSNRNPGSGELYLAALCAVEWSKRYEGVVPRSHPLVQRAMANIESRLGDENAAYYLLNWDSMYEPCLALILLCEVDDEKYKEQIQRMLRWLEGRQLATGAWGYKARPRDDTSQTQYAALAMFVAKHHGFKINYEVPKKAIEWLARVQVQGSWYYHYSGLQAAESDKLTLSLHCSGLGTMYLLADLLQLTRRVNKSDPGNGLLVDLPPSVSVYIKPKDGVENEVDKKGPLVSTNTGAIAAAKSRGNQFLVQNFSIQTKSWQHYYLYALERYAFFREQAEGGVKEIPNWYDQGVDYLRGEQLGDGSFKSGREAALNSMVSTGLAVLFLLRSSEVLVLPSSDSVLAGDIGFQNDVSLRIRNDGKIVSQQAIKGVEDIFALLDSDNDEEALQAIIEGMSFSIKEFVGDDAKSAGEKKAFLRGLVTNKNYFRRLVAVKLLAGEQDMDNVPALLYALSDPDVRIAREAHNGLRLISRRINSLNVPAGSSRARYLAVKSEWEDWFRKIRPDADLLDD